MNRKDHGGVAPPIQLTDDFKSEMFSTTLPPPITVPITAPSPPGKRSRSTSVLDDSVGTSMLETRNDGESQLTQATRRSSHQPQTQKNSGVDKQSIVESTGVEDYAELTFAERHSSWMVSFCVHMFSLIILALIVIPQKQSGGVALDMTMSGNDDLSLELDAFELQTEFEATVNEFDAPEVDTEIAKLVFEIPESSHDPNKSDERMELVPQPLASGALSSATKSAQSQDVTSPPGGVIGRSARRNSALQLGATQQSEEAVDRALNWLVSHQEKDGRWQFDTGRGICDGRCRHSGTSMSVNGATAIALLPFLGAGQTHEKGYHRAKVRRGIEFLIKNQDDDGSFLEPIGSMYSHGLATLVLCEALAMSDAEPSSSSQGRFVMQIKKAAVKAVEYSVLAQHSAGGWRYMPRQPGDTSVLGWQAMAMRSAVMAKLDVPERTLQGVSNFLDSVAGDEYGATYGYTSTTSRDTMTAVGLLCRMYQGWGRQHPGIATGVEYLTEFGPSSNNVYYNYYATQVVHHYGGDGWKDWNSRLRDHLVDTQERKGHASGSWYFDADHGSGVGGRLYVTAMATMILEVYYRHMPIYSGEALEGERL